MKHRILAYIVAVVSEFALTHHITTKEAYTYLRRYMGIDFLERHYDVEHTLSFADVVDDLTTYCHRMGGTL